MIGISTQLFDLDGDFVFYNKDMVADDLTNMNVIKRISKVKTLDGKVYIEDSGFSVGDTDITITVINPTLDLYEKLRAVFIYHSFVSISSENGNLLCVPYMIKLINGNASMVFSTKETA